MELANNELTIELEGDFRVEELEIGGAKIRHSVTKRGGLHADMLDAFSVGAREVRISGYITNSLEENRRKLCRLCTQSQPFYLIDGDYRLELVLSSGVELSSERRFSTKLLKYTIRAIALSPYWLAKDDFNQIFYNCGGESTDDNAIILTNEGDVPTGFTLSALMMSPCQLLTIKLGEKKLSINRAFSSLDRVDIDTRQGKKSVTLYPKNGGEAVNLMEYVNPASEFFELLPGENRIDFVVAQGVSYMTINFSPAFLR